MSEPFIAEIRIFAGNFAPRGWAFCNGQLLPIAQNTALFSILGTTYGGDGRTTTALPDLQGRAPMHPGSGPGLTNRSLGENGGVETVTLTAAEMPSHNHPMNANPNPAEQPGSVGNAFARAVGASLYGGATSLVALADQAMPPAGGSQAHDNLQPFLTMSFIIAMVGIYPPRS